MIDDSGYSCSCDPGTFGNNCENFLCGSKSCGNGEEFITYSSTTSSYCQCDCNIGYSGVFCEHSKESLWGQECKNDSNCTAYGQICDIELNQCRCDLANGYILNEFQAEITYGQCVGPITLCAIDSDCNDGQRCENNRCACDSNVLELCLKNGEWECVKDPLPECLEGILPSGKYGCCDQITGWSESDFDQITSYCQNSNQPSCDDLNCGFYGECIVIGDTPTCDCFDHWSGSNCEKFTHCDPNPCENDAICVETGNHFECQCINDYEGQLCEISPCDESLDTCGDGICSETIDGFQCSCDSGTFGDNCENFLCGTKNCNNGSEFETYTFSGTSYCQCKCDAGFSGALCGTEEETLWGHECLTDEDCSADGQICNTLLQQCRCNESRGYILNEFQAETDYGKCVGPITGCSLDAQCSGGQKCVNERCSCENDVLELCLKNGIWECVKDPLPDCVEGILPSGKYGCCSQIENWVESKFNSTSSYCESPTSDPCIEENISCGFYGVCVSDENGAACLCNDHWSGADCSEFDHCNPNPCENGGTCSEFGNHFECSCVGDFSGQICENDPCSRDPCSIGVCIIEGI